MSQHYNDMTNKSSKPYHATIDSQRYRNLS